jgi:hypothetical protein
MPNVPNKLSIITARYPDYLTDALKWNEWRETYDGGSYYLRKYLKKFSERETDPDFETRLAMTPIATFAKGAVNDIRNAIFQRLSDVVRRDGSKAYMTAVAGENGGVDNNGSSMQSFIGIDVLTELLIMGRTGIYIDSPVSKGATLADVGEDRPYVYSYAVEDILAWSIRKPEQPGEFSAILLRDTGVDTTTDYGSGIELPTGTYTRFRLLWVDEKTGTVKAKFFDNESHPIDIKGNSVNEDKSINLNLKRIPFVMLDVKGSLLKDVSNHQKALLNLGSSDVSYALKANYPFYTEQKDMRAVGAHLKSNVSDEGTTGTTKNNKGGTEHTTGVSRGRAYDLKAERPGFIHPSPEPLMASIALQEKLEDDIRKLVNLSVQNKAGSRQMSAEAIKMSDQGLEAGLSYIGLVLESAEQMVAQHWAAYEDKNPANRTTALVKYPDRYSLKDDKDRIMEAKELSTLMYTVPGKTVKKELAKNIVSALLSGRVDVEGLETIFTEIDDAEYTTSDPDIIIRSQESGLVGEKVASEALGFGEGEYLVAREDHAERAVRILKAQTAATEELQSAQGGAPGGAPAAAPKGAPKGVGNAAARGVGDLATDQKAGKAERTAAVDPTLSDTKKKPQRGPGKSLAKGE